MTFLCAPTKYKVENNVLVEVENDLLVAEKKLTGKGIHPLGV